MKLLENDGPKRDYWTEIRFLHDFTRAAVWFIYSIVNVFVAGQFGFNIYYEKVIW